MVDVTAEVKAINAVLKNGDKQALYSPSVDDLFTSHGDMWAYIKEYHQEYGEMPSFEVIEDRFDGDLEDVKVPGHTKHYMDDLRNYYVDNRVKELLARASVEIRNGTSVNEVKSKLQEYLGQLDRFSTSTRDLDIMDLDNAERRYDEVRERAIAMGGTPGVPTGIKFIDASMPLGMQPGDIISIIGYPARGKSALGSALFPAQQIVRGYKPLIISREMSAEAVQDRIFTVLGSGLFSNSELMLGNVNPDDFITFRSKMTKPKDFHAKIVDGNGVSDITPNFIRGKIDQYQPDVVTVDYLQLLMDNRMSEDMIGRMRNLSLELKSLANQSQKPFVVISSATPPDGGKVDSPPNVERTAWTRQLAYDSSVCIAIHRMEGTNIYQVECAKNRYGPLFSGFLEWDMDKGIYVEKFDLD